MGISVFPPATTSGPTTLPAVGGSIFFAPQLNTKDFGFIEFDFGTPLAAGAYEFTFTGLNYNPSASNTFVAVGTNGTTVLATQTGTSIIGKLTTTAPIQKVAFKNNGNAFGFTNASTSGMTVTPGIKTVTKGIPWAATSTAISMTNFPVADNHWVYKAGYYDRITNTAYHMNGVTFNSAQMYTGVPNLTTGDIVWTARASRTGLSGASGNPHYGSNMGGVENGGGVYWNQGMWYSGSWSSGSDWFFYSLSSNTWTSKASNGLKGQVTFSQVAADKIMAIGGYDYNGTWGTQSRIYNTATDTWANVVNMPTGSYGGIALPNSLTNPTYLVLIANGYQSSGSVSNGPMYYTFSNNTWNVSGTYPWPGATSIWSVSTQCNMQPATDGTSFWFWANTELYKVPISGVFNSGMTNWSIIGIDSTAALYDSTVNILGTNIIIGFGDTNGRKYSTTVTFPSYLS
jgi:hypothetical protein